MAFFEINSDVTIGTFQFSGVHEIRIKRSLHSLADTAFIKIPSIGKIIEGNSRSAQVVTTGNLFKDRDPVVIKLGYNGGMQEEFRGFVKRRNLGMPLEVECEGYVQRLRLDMSVTSFEKNPTASSLLKLITEKLPEIKVVVADDIHLTSVRLVQYNGVQIINEIMKLSQGMLNVFFINPTTLWCGLTYTPYTRGTDPFGLGQVNYRLGWNAIKDNNLKERVTNGERVQILMHWTDTAGKRAFTASEDKTAKAKDKMVLNNIRNAADVQKLANEKQYRVNYAGYQGYITGFLQPYCLAGYKANVVDARYPERNGVYMVESTEVTFGLRGARRKVELGPLIGFNPQSK